MYIPILQAEAAVEKFTADSIQAKTAETLDMIKNTDTNVLLQNLGQQAIQFGLKVLAALAIYIIGGWIIKKIVKLVSKGLEKKGSDAALASFQSHCGFFLSLSQSVPWASTQPLLQRFWRPAEWP